MALQADILDSKPKTAQGREESKEFLAQTYRPGQGGPGNCRVVDQRIPPRVA
jgi:hypothetical protein